VANNAKHPQINLLLTRPKAGSDAFWNGLAPLTRQTLHPIVSPLIRIVPLNISPEFLGDVIFTSVNGVENSPRGEGRIAYCVGATTTKAAVLSGWRAVQKGETADQLVSSFPNGTANTPLTHLAGIHTRGNIAQRLTTAGYEAQHVAVYDQEICPLTRHATEALSSNFPLLVPLFSPRTAHSFADQNKGSAPLHIVALSQEVADQIGDQTWQTLTVSTRPTRLAMVDAVQKVASCVTLG
jgi:uroporphyrinogen-III synthase